MSCLRTEWQGFASHPKTSHTPQYLHISITSVATTHRNGKATAYISDNIWVFHGGFVAGTEQNRTEQLHFDINSVHWICKIWGFGSKLPSVQLSGTWQCVGQVAWLLMLARIMVPSSLGSKSVVGVAIQRSEGVSTPNLPNGTLRSLPLLTLMDCHCPPPVSQIPHTLYTLSYMTLHGLISHEDEGIT